VNQAETVALIHEHMGRQTPEQLRKLVGLVQAAIAAEVNRVAPEDWEQAYSSFKDGPAFPPAMNSLKAAFVAGMVYATTRPASSPRADPPA
jgi:hypothetical protein